MEIAKFAVDLENRCLLLFLSFNCIIMFWAKDGPILVIHMAPVFSGSLSVNALTNHSNLIVDQFNMLLNQSQFVDLTNNTVETTATLHKRHSSIVSWTTGAPSIDVSSVTSSHQPTTPTHRVSYKFKDVISADLFNPCQVSYDMDQSWFEDYFDSTSSQSTTVPSVGDISKSINSDTDSHPEDSESLLIDHLYHEEKKILHKFSLAKLMGRAKIGFDLMQEMILKSNYLQGLVTDMIRKNLIQECQQLKLRNLIEFPKEKLSDSNLVDSLSAVYQTLANQTAHLYFIWSQQRKNFRRSDGCADHAIPMTVTESKRAHLNLVNKKAHARRVADDFLVVSTNLRGLMCHFKQSFYLFDIPVSTGNIVQQVLDHTVQSSLVCARMSVLDCQIMRNSVQIFAAIEEFLRNQSHRFLARFNDPRPRTINL